MGATQEALSIGSGTNSKFSLDFPNLVNIDAFGLHQRSQRLMFGEELSLTVLFESTVSRRQILMKFRLVPARVSPSGLDDRQSRYDCDLSNAGYKFLVKALCEQSSKSGFA
jgi:hypothetical protein